MTTIAVAVALALVVTAGPVWAQGGSEIWVARLDVMHHSDVGTSVGTSPDGATVYVAGTSTSGGAASIVVAAYAAGTGANVWTATYQGSSAADMAVAPDGTTLFVTGVTSDGTAVVAFDAATGAVRWSATNTKVGYVYAVAVSPDGSTVAVSGNEGYFARMATIGYDTASGTQIWLNALTDGGFESTSALDVAAGPDGRAFFVTGYAYNGNSEEYLTEAVDVATGRKLWSGRYNSPHNGYDYGHAVTVSPDSSRVFVTGCSASSGSTGVCDYGTVAYDAASGRLLWTKVYDSGSDDSPEALAVSADGSVVYVTGSFGAGNGQNIGTFAYDAATGAPRWLATYDGPAHGRDFAEAIGVSLDGATVYVAGTSTSQQGLDYATLAYAAADGSQLWVDRYDDGGNDTAHGLAVCPVGSCLYVTGESVGQGTNRDVATVALTG